METDEMKDGNGVRKEEIGMEGKKQSNIEGGRCDRKK